MPGFGARRQKDRASYVLKYRTLDGRQRWHTIGRHGAPWTPDLARAEARRLLGEIVSGGDPAADRQEGRKAATVAELADLYLADATSGKILRRGKAKKASTLATDKGRVERHIKPQLGSLKVKAVTRLDVERFYNAVASGETAATVKTGKHGLARVTGGRGTATRTLALVGVIFSYAVRLGLRPDNPTHGVEKHGYEQRERRASDAEYAALGAALHATSNQIVPVAREGVRFLALTGWRRGEMLALKWAEVDLAARTARLSDTKTGASSRPLSRAACAVLKALPRSGTLVFPSPKDSEKPMGGFHKIWLRLAEAADLPSDVTPHVLRHSFASVAADLGLSELTIGALIGHKGRSITSRYIHSADAVLLAAADLAADRIVELMEAKASFRSTIKRRNAVAIGKGG
ncbi:MULTISPECIES: site-specific integrase [unclassified Methylosinus]|uniref:tyrosine-type recombinase/integrase n=1 Tax=unclassified Methylosinus TaxID=2624500 RepID=UPI0018DE587A|nr:MULTISPECIES: tyrosine-type recombinase/integrase [unclassified Methylosinus]